MTTPIERKRWDREAAGSDVAPWHASFQVLMAIAGAETVADVGKVMDTHNLKGALREFRDHIYKNKMKPDRPGRPGCGDRTGIRDGRLKADMDRLIDVFRTNPLWRVPPPQLREEHHDRLYNILESIFDVLRVATYHYRR